jgi:hypothetical protein
MDSFAENIAWVAGLFEGEGCISLQKSPKGESWCQIVVRLVSTDRDVVEKFHCIVMVGTVRSSKPKIAHHKEQHTWSASGKEAEQVLSLLGPWLCSRRQERIAEVISLRRDYESRKHAISSEASRRSLVTCLNSIGHYNFEDKVAQAADGRFISTETTSV